MWRSVPVLVVVKCLDTAFAQVGVPGDHCGNAHVLHHDGCELKVSRVGLFRLHQPLQQYPKPGSPMRIPEQGFFMAFSVMVRA